MYIRTYKHTVACTRLLLPCELEQSASDWMASMQELMAHTQNKFLERKNSAMLFTSHMNSLSGTAWESNVRERAEKKFCCFSVPLSLFLFSPFVILVTNLWRERRENDVEGKRKRTKESRGNLRSASSLFAVIRAWNPNDNIDITLMSSLHLSMTCITRRQLR